MGGVAQLGERLNGIQEVSGSIPLSSTTLCKRTFGEGLSGFSQRVSLCQLKELAFFVYGRGFFLIFPLGVPLLREFL